MSLQYEADARKASGQQTENRYTGTGESGCQVTSAALLGGRNALAIHHKGERYILRLTRAGKLILTK